MLPADPKNPASPKVKTPPSEADQPVALPAGVAAIPTIGWFTWLGAPKERGVAERAHPDRRRHG